MINKMIQNETYLNVCDNSGAKTACCIKILGSSKKKYAYLGDLLKVSIKKINTYSKIKRGEVYNSVLIRSVYNFKRFDGSYISFNENSIVILNSKNEPCFTRIFGPVLKEFKKKNILGSKIISLSSIII
ncbi:50S ribosomal protein L14 [Candidatus Nasuia deltocephalinicola]|uniref:50S ribosomal protein L14 n=1 Tax=Candidatus Nasuia deltocephalincola TaxID=1160784 RepID=UPI00216AD5CB|nr:50S ribosomal protein L14 [Candidatus Nasuia deltocephalinicola]